MAKLRTLFSQINQRLLHALIAAAITVVMVLSTVVMTADRVAWNLQSRIAESPASGEIVFVGVQEDVTDPAFPERRERLAQALQELDRLGAERVFLDIVIDEPSTPASDTELGDAIASLGDRVYLTERYVTGMSGDLQPKSTIPSIVDDNNVIGSLRIVDLLGFSWEMPYQVGEAESRLTSLPSELAHARKPYSDEFFLIDYHISLASVPTSTVSDILDSESNPAAAAEKIKGKTVVLGEAWKTSDQRADIPGHLDIPASLVSIIAAETLLSGHISHVGPCTVLAVTLLGLALILVLLRGRAMRRAGYAALIVALPLALVISAQFGIRISIMSGVVLLVVYGGFRLRSSWQEKYSLVDPIFGLPTFRALERKLDQANADLPLVVAKIHGYEDVVKAVPQADHVTYMLRLIDRLKVTQSGLAIYNNEGRYFAWEAAELDAASLGAHLEGLRALFTQPLRLSNTEVDSGITFGVDLSQNKGGAARIASALAAVEQTSEAHAPIRFDEIGSDSDDLWNISLQARIDAALDNDEIFLVYQPKICLKTGRMIGVESLVRWNDPNRGEIAPSYFIDQCEKAGRMDHLTRHVLYRALEDSKFFAQHECDISIAVNISATLLRDGRVGLMVRNALSETGSDPKKLILEITETSRISDMNNARSVLESLSEIGVRISLDDFGMGAANVEALFELPFHELKIDRLFVRHISQPKGAAIVRGLIVLGDLMNLSVVAEGVEESGMIKILNGFACPLAQGYAISYPIRREEIVRFAGVNKKLIN